MVFGRRTDQIKPIDKIRAKILTEYPDPETEQEAFELVKRLRNDLAYLMAEEVEEKIKRRKAARKKKPKTIKIKIKESATIAGGQ